MDCTPSLSLGITHHGLSDVLYFIFMCCVCLCFAARAWEDMINCFLLTFYSSVRQARRTLAVFTQLYVLNSDYNAYLVVIVSLDLQNICGCNIKQPFKLGLLHFDYTFLLKGRRLQLQQSTWFQLHEYFITRHM